jgi:hypothetical protein
MANQIKYKTYTYKSVAISVKTPYEELIDHIIKEEKNGWLLFSIQAVVGEPFIYVVTLFK